jgi:hypothetical protein
MKESGASQNKKYTFIAQVGQAVCLPSDKKYNIKVTVGGHMMTFQPFDQKKASTYKRYGRVDQTTVELPYMDVFDMSKVIVQLMDKDDPVCYWIGKVKDFTDPNAKMNWYPFTPDKCVNKVTQPFQVGQFSFKMSIHDEEKNGEIDFKQFPAWKKKVPKRSNPVRVRAYIYQCRDLPAADAEGTSDPYVQVWDTKADKKNRKQTIVVDDNNNPLFYETIELDYEVDDQKDLESYPPFIFDIFDYDDDIFDSTPDFLCRAIVEPEDCGYSLLEQSQFERCKEHQQEHCQLCANLNLEIPEKPKWWPCYFTPGTPQCGEILVSFSVTDLDYNYPCSPKEVDLTGRVQTNEFECNMLILGLRNL